VKIQLAFCLAVVGIGQMTARGQQIPSLDLVSSNSAGPAMTYDRDVASAPVPVAALDAQAPASMDPAHDKGLHISVSPYLWFAGLHGTVGALGHNASIHASAGDVLSKLNIGLMGAGEFRKGRFVAPFDFMWIKLSDDKALPGVVPVTTTATTSIKAKVTQSMLTPKVGYRVIDGKALKVDGLVGLRYWHLGTSLLLEPSNVSEVSQSANWVDVVAGAKMQLALSPKVAITVLGDAGGGGANSEYQVAGLMAYRIKKAQLQAGWRYLDVHYLGGSQFVYSVAQSGLVLGVTFNLK
jgi:hypothetical protein